MGLSETSCKELELIIYNALSEGLSLGDIARNIITALGSTFSTQEEEQLEVIFSTCLQRKNHEIF